MNIAFLSKHLTLPHWAKGIGIYGSWAKGTNNAESDVQLWILVEHNNQLYAPYITEYRDDLSGKLGYKVLTKPITKDMIPRDKEISFYRELPKDQIVVLGEGIDPT